MSTGFRFCKYVIYLTLFQENPTVNAKKVHCVLLPPCAKTVCNKLRWAHVLSIIWRNAESSHTNGLDPLKYGWKYKSRYCAPGWFTGPAIPAYLFCEVDSMENLQNGLLDATRVYWVHLMSMIQVLTYSGVMTQTVKLRSQHCVKQTWRFHSCWRLMILYNTNACTCCLLDIYEEVVTTINVLTWAETPHDGI